MAYQDNVVPCSRPGCVRTVVLGSKWDKIRAHEQGWFFQKEGQKVWCPDHIPYWAAEWRAKKAAQQSQKP